MAWDPCVSCGREFHGSTVYTYASWFVGEQRFSYRFRQCEDCAADLRTQVQAQGDIRNDQGTWTPSPLIGARLTPMSPNGQLPKDVSESALRKREIKRIRQQARDDVS